MEHNASSYSSSSWPDKRQGAVYVQQVVKLWNLQKRVGYTTTGEELKGEQREQFHLG